LDNVCQIKTKCYSIQKRKILRTKQDLSFLEVQKNFFLKRLNFKKLGRGAHAPPIHPETFPFQALRLSRLGRSRFSISLARSVPLVSPLQPPRTRTQTALPSLFPPAAAARPSLLRSSRSRDKKKRQRSTAQDDNTQRSTQYAQERAESESRAEPTLTRPPPPCWMADCL